MFLTVLQWFGIGPWGWKTFIFTLVLKLSVLDLKMLHLCLKIAKIPLRDLIFQLGSSFVLAVSRRKK